MACPKCGCKVHYQYNDADFGPDDERLERCAACGAVFDIEDSADEDDDDVPERLKGDALRSSREAGCKQKGTVARAADTVSFVGSNPTVIPTAA